MDRPSGRTAGGSPCGRCGHECGQSWELSSEDQHGNLCHPVEIVKAGSKYVVPELKGKVRGQILLGWEEERVLALFRVKLGSARGF